MEKPLAYYDEKLCAIGPAYPGCQRLQTIRGIVRLSATALITAIGDMTLFKNGRQLAAWLGLVPEIRRATRRAKERSWSALRGPTASALALHGYRQVEAAGGIFPSLTSYRL